MNLFTQTLAFGMPGWQELLILGVIGILIFGKRLPEVGRSIGRGIVEFKKGLAGIDEEVEAAAEAQRKFELEQQDRAATNVDTTKTEDKAETSNSGSTASNPTPPGASA